jgi:hypothetical protein
MSMDDGIRKKRRAESIRLWLHTSAALISALAPIVIEVIRHSGS